MKIKLVDIEKFKVLENLHKEINGNNIMLIGDNGVGKSSFIQFIEIALGKSTNIPPDAIGKGYIVVDKDGKEWTFKVKVNDGKSQVTITSPEGLEDKRKGSLSTLIGAMEFDILEFVELSKSAAGRKKQIEIYKGFLPKDIITEIDRLEANVKSKYDERTELNKGLKALEIEVQAHSLNAFMDSKLQEFQPTDTKAVYEKIREAQKHNEKIKEVENRMAERNRAIEKALAEIKKLQSEIDANETLNSQAKDWLKDKAVIDTIPFETEISTAEETNTKHRAAQELIRKRKQFEETKSEAGEMTALIESERQAISDAIKDMGEVVPGLSFDAENLLYNGVSVSPDSLSTSEIMELGIRLKMAENPELGILFIQRGESLGAKRLEDIKAIAKKSGWQLIMEQVQRGKERLEIELIND